MDIQQTAISDFSDCAMSMGLRYMITGSVALSYYATPRMTRDLDIVLDLKKIQRSLFTRTFKRCFRINETAIDHALEHESSFNLLHENSVMKIDCFILKNHPFDQEEFKRRREIRFQDVETTIISKEDLIVSKLNWSKDTHSEMQVSDIRNLLGSGYNRSYVVNWVQRLELNEIWKIANE